MPQLLNQHKDDYPSVNFTVIELNFDLILVDESFSQQSAKTLFENSDLTFWSQPCLSVSKIYHTILDGFNKNSESNHWMFCITTTDSFNSIQDGCHNKLSKNHIHGYNSVNFTNTELNNYVVVAMCHTRN